MNLRRPLRLRLSPSIGRGVLDGAWWPYSRDLATEAVDLVDHFPASFDRICRVVYSTPDWEPSPRRVKAAIFKPWPDRAAATTAVWKPRRALIKLEERSHGPGARLADQAASTTN